MELISVGNEDTKYLINRFVLQESGNLLGGLSDCEELVGFLTGDDGVEF